MNWIDIKDLIAGVGFPIFVAVYLLIKIEPALKQMSMTMASLSDVIGKLCEKIK